MGAANYIIKLYKNNFERLEFYDAYERGYIKKISRIKKGMKVLDLGSGIGNMLKRIAGKNGKGYGIEISKENIRLAKKYNPEFEHILGSAENLPFKNDFFDVVISTSSLEHMDNLEKVFKEVFRVLKTGGKFIFSIDCFENNYISEGFKKEYFKERAITPGRGGKEAVLLLNKNNFGVIKRKYIFNSGLGCKMHLFGLKLSENKFARLIIVPLLSPIFLPLIKILDFFNKNRKGNVFIAEAVKND